MFRPVKKVRMTTAFFCPKRNLYWTVREIIAFKQSHKYLSYKLELLYVKNSAREIQVAISIRTAANDRV